MMHGRVLGCIGALLVITTVGSIFAGTAICDTKKMYAPFNHESVVKDSLKSVASKALDLHRELFRWDSFKIVVAAFPAIVVARGLDDCIQNCFINRKEHKNIHQMSDFFEQFAKNGIVFPLFLAMALSISARDDNTRATSRMFLIGLPFAYACSQVIKRLNAGRIDLRPWREGFCCHKRAHGGFPSGHMTAYGFATTLFGMRLGPRYWLPLGTMTILSIAAFANCNRHYLSQMMAGCALGALYAFAADKVVEKNLAKDLNMGIGFDSGGSPCLSCSYAF